MKGLSMKTCEGKVRDCSWMSRLGCETHWRELKSPFLSSSSSTVFHDGCN